MYKSKREEIKEFINKKVLPLLKNEDLDYTKLINAIAHETSSGLYMVEEILNNYIEAGAIKKIITLTIPDSNLPSFMDYLKDKRERDNQTKKDLKELDNLIKGGEKNT